MIESFKNTSGALLRNPLVLLPALVSVIIAFLLSYLASWPMIEMLYEFAIENSGMQLDFFEMIVAFYNSYTPRLYFFLIAFFVATALFSVMLFFYSKYAMHYSEKDAFSSSLKYMLSRVPRACGLTVFVVSSFFLMAFTLFAVILFVPAVLNLNAVLFLALTVIFAFVFLKLYLFAVPAIVHDDESVRAGLSKSWAFTEKRLLETILALVIVFFFSMVIAQAGVFLIAPLGEGIATLLIAAVFNSIVFAFSSMFFAFYYFNNYTKTERKKRRGKGK